MCSSDLPCPTEMFSSLPALRTHIRESGRQLAFPELGIVVEGVLYGGHLAVKHMVESDRDSPDQATHQKESTFAVSASAKRG